MLCVGLEVADETGVIVILLITLLLVAEVVICRGERKTVPVDKVISLFSATEATGLTTIFGWMLLPK